VVSGRAVLGAAPGVDVVIADPAISRLHAELELRDDGLWVRDLESRNGTWVDGVLVSGARVGDGGRIRVGATEIVVRYPDVATPVELHAGDRFGPLLGRSVVMRELFVRLARVAPTDSTVLVQGETGTGKELVAEALHAASPRASQPFVVVDCAALPENLLEAELFGHTRGAFTGAVAARAGAFEAAEGGTVFLDEVAELPLSMQPKLLRALEARAVRRVGETAYRKVDVRVIAATHRDLRAMVNARAFREDLYFRLAVLPVTLPPLRARPEDIPALAAHFVPAGAAPVLTAELNRELSARPWLGNVRELRNFVERALALGAREALAMSATHAPRPADPDAMPAVSIDEPFKDLRERWVDHLEREYVRAMLARHHGNVSAVAQASGLDRTYVHRLIRKHELP
jgi:transcriptional regulator with GAF, ATPase, and Fis domain